MEVTVKLKYLRISPRKTRLIADKLKRKTVPDAEKFLEFARKKGAEPILKLLKSGIAAAGQRFEWEKNNLYISIIKVDEGPTLKRSRARARGRFFPILKRSSHITMTLKPIEIKKQKPKKGKKLVGKPFAEKTVKSGDKPKVRKSRTQKKTIGPKIKTRREAQKTFRRKSF